MNITAKFYVIIDVLLFFEVNVVFIQHLKIVDLCGFSNKSSLMLLLRLK